MNTDTPNQPTEGKKRPSNVRAYFTKEVNDQINAISFSEMEVLLKGLVNTREWFAILKWTSERSRMLDNSLRFLNPFKDPDQICKVQGTMAGLCDIENCVIDLNAPPSPADKAEKEAPEPLFGGNVLGS